MEKTEFERLLEYQNFVQRRLMTEQKTDRKIELISIINQLTAGPNNIVQKEQIIIEATNRGFSEAEVTKLIEELKKDNIVYESSPGYFKKK